MTLSPDILPMRELRFLRHSFDSTVRDYHTVLIQNKNRKDCIMEELKINVSTVTADALHKAAEEAKLSIGEIVDRMVLTVAPDDPDIAWTLALEQYLICTARLSEEGSAKAFGNMCGLFLGSMPPEEFDNIVSRVKSNQILEDYTPESITEEERDEFRKALTKILYSTRNAPVRKKVYAFLMDSIATSFAGTRQEL